MRRSVLLIVLFLAGCVVGPDRRVVLSRFIGADEATLVQGLGVPNRTYTANGIKFLAYTERRTEYLPPPISPFGWGGYGYGYGYGYGWYPPYGPTVVQYGCETTFEVVEGRVRSFSLRGNACG